MKKVIHVNKLDKGLTLNKEQKMKAKFLGERLYRKVENEQS